MEYYEVVMGKELVRKTVEGIAEFRKDKKWFEQNRGKLLKRFPEQHVAVLHQKVVGNGPDLEDLLTGLKRREVPVNQAYVEYLTARKLPVLILGSNY